LFSLDAAAAGVTHAWRPRLRAAVAAFRVALRTSITRRELVELDEWLLADIGLSRAEATVEAARRPWDFGRRRERPEPPRQVSMWDHVYAAWRLHVTRQRIAGLNAHMLKDIGVSYAEAEAEANKPFWIH
jgi:uncharacterized protein YjiS (DUF1127 family)